MNYIQSSRYRENMNIEILDELLRKVGLNRDEYTQLNKVLDESLGTGKDEEGEEEEVDEESDKGGEESAEEDKTEDEYPPREETMKKLIQSTVEYLIQHDKKELLELINEFRADVAEDFLDTVLVLEEIVDVYLLEEIIRKLEGSTILKCRQNRLKVMLDTLLKIVIGCRQP